MDQSGGFAASSWIVRQVAREKLRIIVKEMGITHKDFYGELPELLDGIPYHQSEGNIRFQLNRREVEIVIGAEKIRMLGPSVRLPVTFVTLRFFDCSEEEINEFIGRFNLRFMKGGG